MEIGRSRTTIGQTIMRLLATFFVLVFSSSVFSQAISAPHDPAITPRKSTVDPSNAADTKKNKETKNAKKSGTSTQDKKKIRSQPPKTQTTVDANNNKNAKRGVKHASAVTRITSNKEVSPRQSTQKSVKKISRPLTTLASTKKMSKRVHPASMKKEKTTASRITRSRKDDVVETDGLTLSAAHKQRSQRARVTAMNKLMSQIGKPYHWGGSSPYTGFDCSGLVYYAYKDIVKIPIPRTANEMFHLRDAAPIKKNELESGDLVFFRINHRGTADHVGVYVGNGKFIQSPRAGSDIKISKLSEDYWQEHYIGARRVVMPQTVR